MNKSSNSGHFCHFFLKTLQLYNHAKSHLLNDRTDGMADMRDHEQGLQFRPLLAFLSELLELQNPAKSHLLDNRRAGVADLDDLARDSLIWRAVSRHPRRDMIERKII